MIVEEKTVEVLFLVDRASSLRLRRDSTSFFLDPDCERFQLRFFLDPTILSGVFKNPFLRESLSNLAYNSLKKDACSS